MRPVVLGAIAGGAAAVLLSRTLSGLLFGVSPFDLLGIGAAAAFVVVVAFAAAIVPGRRAARVQPMRALHYE
jgi:ABC-type antimicrobial peptide transport system permease subunit